MNLYGTTIHHCRRLTRLLLVLFWRSPLGTIPKHIHTGLLGRGWTHEQIYFASLAALILLAVGVVAIHKMTYGY